MKTQRDKCIALSGVFQAADLASRIARRGMADSQAMESSIYSLFQINANTVEAVYGGLPGVSQGLKTLLAQLSGEKNRNIDMTRYVISLLHLERKLSKQPDLLQQLGEGISSTNERLEHFPMLHPNILAGMADIYSNTISTLRPRIMIQGEPLHLQNTENVNRIRALLLAGIRSAMLWRQCGGNRLQILLSRKRLLETAHYLHREIKNLPVRAPAEL
ncbi:MAG: high frequency lysogenization protein HflD [Gammaproteobacteria bacterium]|nr:high frequency lysogenization protein HflD [Gammaproteobacteria bacterium]